MRGRKVVLLLILVMAAVSAGVAGIAMHMLYGVAFAGQRARLVETAQSQARLIEAIARFAARHSRHADSEGPAAATLRQIIVAHKLYKGSSDTGESSLGRMRISAKLGGQWWFEESEMREWLRTRRDSSVPNMCVQIAEA